MSECILSFRLRAIWPRAPRLSCRTNICSQKYIHRTAQFVCMAFRSKSSANRIKKRKYSRRGCVECKRRKIKCDEALPECFNCTRLHKSCSYPVVANQGPETVAVPLSKNGGSLEVRFYEPQKSSPAVIVPESLPSPGTRPPIEPQHKSIPTTNSALRELRPMHNYTELPFSPIELGSSLGGSQDLDLKNLYNEANVLVNEMHGFLDGAESFGLEKSIWEEVNGVVNSSMDPKSYLDSGFSQETYGKSVSNRYVGSPENSGLIAEISAKAHLDPSHITYLQTLTNTNLSYHLFPLASSIESNEVIKILLNYSINCEYLLNALLAITATFQFNQSGGSKHEAQRSEFIKKCFSALSTAFKENLGFENTWIFTNNVEKLLLTVLVLTSNFTAYNNNDDMASQWIAHLKGARDLLLNYSKIKRKDESNMSSGLALAKCWFFAIESSAAVHSGTGGSLSKNGGHSRLDSFSDPDDDFTLSEGEQQKRAMADAGDLSLDEDIYLSTPRVAADEEASKLRQIFQDTGNVDGTVNSEYCHALERAQLLNKRFNLYWGYTSKIAEVHMMYASVVEEIKSRTMAKVETRWTMHLIGMVDACSQEQIVPKTKPDTFIIPAGTQGHPEYTGTDKLVFKDSCYLEENGVIRSWFDLTNQFHCDDLYLKILTSWRFMALPRSHPDVQSIVRKVFKGSFFIREKPVDCVADVIVESTNYYLSKKTFDVRCIMIQAVFRALSGIVSEERDFERLELFFLGLVKLGNGSSLTSLDKLTKCRKRRDKMKSCGIADDGCYDLYGASVIPFA